MSRLFSGFGKNVLKAIEMGIIDSDTKKRMDELQALKADLLLQIDHEEAEKPILSKDQIAFWLTSFKKGDAQNEEYRRRIIDTLVNCVYVYDTDSGKEITIVCNLSGQNTFKVECSDFEGQPPLTPGNLEKSGFPGFCFGIEWAAFGFSAKNLQKTFSEIAVKALWHNGFKAPVVCIVSAKKSSSKCVRRFLHFHMIHNIKSTAGRE